MPERSNGAVSKTVVLSDRDRGFESPFLRKPSYNRTPGCGFFIFANAIKSLLL